MFQGPTACQTKRTEGHRISWLFFLVLQLNS